MGKDLPTIISHVKRVRIILERDRPASILGILDNGKTVIVDSNRRRTTIINRATINDSLHEVQQLRKLLDLALEVSSSQLVEDDDEVKASYDEDEAGAQNTIPMDAF
ncbi:hypothetical protein M9H77_17786 [Catharanthus roseus]|uniref:Uncharacterized protein n=1 Tax=Catharanthus roseus TaxID=4058 RepID=A0ACC0B5N3_CATRO|nr:hypothetical protein M9H77_17786 [Catharanthus roseus]